MYIPWKSDILQLLVICKRLKELKVRLTVYTLLEITLVSWLDKWVIEGAQPQNLNFTVGKYIPLTNLVKHWLRLNPCSPTGHTGCLKVSIINSLKVSMDLFPAIPDFQLQFGRSCTLQFLKPSN